MNKITFQDGTLKKQGYVLIDGQEVPIVDTEYEGNTPLSAEKLNQLQTNIEDAIDGVVESGSNTNGNWIKYSDGTMICYGTKSESYAVTSTWGVLYTSSYSTPIQITYPVEFTNTPSFNIGMKKSNSGILLNWSASSNDKTQSDKYVIARPLSSQSQEYSFQWQAIGKWK